MENDPFIEDFPIKTSIYRGFSMAFDVQHGYVDVQHLVVLPQGVHISPGEANKGWATSMRNLKRALINNDLSQQLDESFSAKGVL